MTHDAVDVIIPVYNAASTLEEAVHSIQVQSHNAIRIVLVDDGSTDETPALIARISAKDERVLVLTQENCGIVDALNRGWMSCDAPFIARHDADDIARPDRLEKQVAFLRGNPAVVAVSGAFRHINLNGVPTGEIVRLPPLGAADPTWVPAREPYLMHPFLMMRRSALETVGGYRYVFHAEDADLYWRLQEHGDLYNLPDVLGDYRLNPNSVSSRSILNGRVQSLGSQLAALSASRRRAQHKDLSFPKHLLEDYHSAYNLAPMLEVASSELTSAETNYLAIAVAEKLRGLSAYRPYELELTDCQFIATSYHNIGSAASPSNKKEVAVRLSGAVARLALKGKIRHALALCPPSLYISALSRIIGQLILPVGAWQALRGLLKRSQTDLHAA